MEETENPLELGKVDANPDLESDTFSNDDISLSLIHISEPTRPY